MKKDQEMRRRPKDSTDIVAPFARIRIIVFLICLAIAFAVLIFKAVTG